LFYDVFLVPIVRYKVLMAYRTSGLKIQKRSHAVS